MHAVRTASGHPVCRVAYSPCRSWFATAQPHHGVTLYDRTAGTAVRTFGNARRPDYTSLTFFRDGARLAAAGSKGLEVLDTHTGATVATVTRAWARGLRLAASGDTLLAAGLAPVMEIYESTPSGILTWRPMWYGTHEVPFVVAPGGRWAVALRSNGSPVAVDMVVGWPAHTLKNRARSGDTRHTETGTLAVFATAADRIAIGDGKAIEVFDLVPRAEYPAADDAVPGPLEVRPPVFTLPPPDRWPAQRSWRPPVALTPDGRGLLVKRPRERVQLWDVDAGALAAEWSWRLDGITCLAVAPDGLTAVAGARFGRVLTWDLA